MHELIHLMAWFVILTWCRFAFIIDVDFCNRTTTKLEIINLSFIADLDTSWAKGLGNFRPPAFGSCQLYTKIWSQMTFHMFRLAKIQHNKDPQVVTETVFRFLPIMYIVHTRFRFRLNTDQVPIWTSWPKTILEPNITVISFLNTQVFKRSELLNVCNDGKMCFVVPRPN